MPDHPTRDEIRLLDGNFYVGRPHEHYAWMRAHAPVYRDPVGEAFPTTVGRTLEEERVELPAAYAGAPAVLLVGYEQEAQFDADRWIYALLKADLDVRIVELPTIPGLVPSWISGWIDEGMRSGIPREDWGQVVTVYGDAARPIAELTGTAKGRNMRVLLLDAGGVVRWFHDRGFSAGKLLELEQRLDEL